MKKKRLLSGLGCAIAICIGFNQPTPINTKAQLGQKLFFDPILSKDRTISCASCHIPAFGFADTLAISLGVNATPGSRNAPTVMNLRGHDPFFWDGRAASLEEQALMPIENPVEMNLPVREAIKRLNNSKVYKPLFLSMFKQLPSSKNLGLALAAYQNTLETDESAFDLDEMSASAERGRALFVSDKTKCFDCHNGPDFTNDDLVKEASILEDYDHSLLGEVVFEDRDCYKIQLIPKPKSAVVWGKIIMAIDKKDFMMLHVEYFDEDKVLVNTMHCSDIKMLGSRLLPGKMEMIPTSKKGNKTVLIYNSIVFDTPLEDSFFSTQNITKVR